ncbi:hypothetical protein I5R53_05955 [Serratia ureilytica]|nr:hypothetical protein [Serratia ureilytica]MBH3266284.1 hypothetical protein [Serratia ureilytica]
MDQARNLPHIASMALNEPLLLEPAYARVFFCALGNELGVGRLIDGTTNTVLSPPQMTELAASYGPGRVTISDSQAGKLRGEEVEQDRWSSGSIQ